MIAIPAEGAGHIQVGEFAGVARVLAQGHEAVEAGLPVTRREDSADPDEWDLNPGWWKDHGPDWRVVIRNYMSVRSQPDVRAYYDLGELSKEVKTPALIMRGDEDDTVHPIADAIQLRANLKNSWLWVIPKVRHSLMRDCPEKACEFIEEFVASL